MVNVTAVLVAEVVTALDVAIVAVVVVGTGLQAPMEMVRLVVHAAKSQDFFFPFLCTLGRLLARVRVCMDGWPFFSLPSGCAWTREEGSGAAKVPRVGTTHWYGWALDADSGIYLLVSAGNELQQAF